MLNTLACALAGHQACHYSQNYSRLCVYLRCEVFVFVSSPDSSLARTSKLSYVMMDSPYVTTGFRRSAMSSFRQTSLIVVANAIVLEALRSQGELSSPVVNGKISTHYSSPVGTGRRWHLSLSSSSPVSFDDRLHRSGGRVSSKS